MIRRSINIKRCYSSAVRNFKTPSSTAVQRKKNLIGLTLPDLQEELAGLTHSKKFTPLQIWQHVYKKGYTEFADMPNLSKDLQLELGAKYEVNYGEVKVIICTLNNDSIDKLTLFFPVGQDRFR